MANRIHKVFVYGTLKKGEPNHHWLTDIKNGAASFVAKATTDSKYPLVIATRYNIPFLLDRPGDGYNVAGEIYEVDDKMLSNLDILEDHPSLYVRELANVSNDDRYKHIYQTNIYIHKIIIINYICNLYIYKHKHTYIIGKIKRN